MVPTCDDAAVDKVADEVTPLCDTSGHDSGSCGGKHVLEEPERPLALFHSVAGKKYVFGGYA